MPCCAPFVCHPQNSLGLNQPTCDHASPPPPPPGQANQITAIDLEAEHHAVVNAEHICTPFETALYYADTASTGTTLAYYMLMAHDPTGNGGASTCDQGYPSEWTTHLTGSFAQIAGAKMPNTDLPVGGPGVTATFDYYMHAVFGMAGQEPYLRVWVPTLGMYCAAAFVQPSTDFMETYGMIWNEWPIFAADGTLHVPTCNPARRRLYEVFKPSPPPVPSRLSEDEDDEALLWMSHPVGNSGRREPPPKVAFGDEFPESDASLEPEPSPTPEPSSRRLAEEEAAPPSDSEYEWGKDPEAWWNNLEISRCTHELYARRVLPEAHGRSAAASVALAITLAHPNRSVMFGQAATLYAMCGALGGCEQGDYWTSMHERDDADVNEDTPDPKHLPIDDAGWALQLLSRAIEPAVHAVVEGMLICLAPALCATHCDVCNEWVGLGNATAEEVLRETELRLHKSIRKQSRSVLDCVGSFECLSEVATEVAEVVGSARELPATVRMEQVAKANAELLEGAREEAKQNASWQVRRPARFALLRAHIAAVRAHEQTPLGEDDAVAESGRRLAERPPPSPPPLTDMQRAMKARTNETCRQLALKNSTAAHDSHVQATHLWMVRPLSNPNPTITHAHTTDACVCPFLVFGGRRQRPARPGPDLR